MCATSIGANIEEGRAGQTKPDFIAKNFISLKESRETRFWLRSSALRTLHYKKNCSRYSRRRPIRRHLFVSSLFVLRYTVTYASW
jgi:four helix bundle protein